MHLYRALRRGERFALLVRSDNFGETADRGD